jgi:hypothetical protein
MKRGMKIDSKQCLLLCSACQQESNYKGKEIHEKRMIETHHNSKPHSTFKMPSPTSIFPHTKHHPDSTH